MILAVQGSPKPNSNLQRMVERIARKTGYEYEMVHLSKLRISPCLGCVKCAPTNRCIQNDDMAPLYDKIEASDALILGGVNYFAAPNGFTRNFMERMFPLRHREPTTWNKPSLAVAVGGDAPQAIAEQLSTHLATFFHFNNVGHVFFKTENPPCFTCGYGTECSYGAPAMWWSREELDNLTEIPDTMFRHFEQHSEALYACDTMADALKSAIEQGVPDHPRAGAGYSRTL